MCSLLMYHSLKDYSYCSHYSVVSIQNYIVVGPLLGVTAGGGTTSGPGAGTGVVGAGTRSIGTGDGISGMPGAGSGRGGTNEGSSTGTGSGTLGVPAGAAGTCGIGTGDGMPGTPGVGSGRGGTNAGSSTGTGSLMNTRVECIRMKWRGMNATVKWWPMKSTITAIERVEGAIILRWGSREM
jgi:hypothetical protein